MIGPDVVLTSAQNVYLRGIGEIRKDSMIFCPGMNGRDARYGSLIIKEVYYLEEYIENPNEDYALLVLDDSIGECTGYFGIHDGSKGKIEGSTVSLYGYPGAMPGQDRYDHYLLGMEGSFKIDNKSDIIDHSIHTSTGQIGIAFIY